MTDALDTEARDALRAEALKWVAGSYPDGRRRAALASAGALDREAWAELAALGWLGLQVPESAGGAGAGPAEFAAVAEALGAGLVAEPVATTGGTVAWLLARLEGTDDDLAAIAAGRAVAAFAHQETAAGFDRALVSTRAAPEGDGIALAGAKAAVPAAEVADVLFVTAREADGALGIYRVPAGTPGLEVAGFRTIDGRRAGDVTLSDVRLPASARISGAEDAVELVDAALDVAALFAAAEAVGAMDALMEDTAAYLAGREQFGRPLSSFQVLQHRMVDMYVALEEARGAVEAALATLDGDPGERRAAVAVARTVAGRAANTVAREAVQLHGGMGVSDEMRVGHLFKRCLVEASRHGDADWYRRRFEGLREARIV